MSLIPTGIALILLMSLVSCKDKSDGLPASGVFLTIKKNPNITWVFATDNDGNILAVNSKKNDTTLTLSSFATIPDTITITVVQDLSTTIYFSTISGVPKNSVYTVQPTVGDAYVTKQVGGANLMITGFTSNPYSQSLIFSDNRQVTQSEPSSGSYVPWAIQDTDPDVFVSCYDNTIPVYYWFKNIKNKDLLSVDFSSFTPFQKTINLDYTYGDGILFSGSVQGGNTAYLQEGFMFFRTYPYSGAPPIIGYLEGYDHYYTNFILTSGNATTQYFKHGAINPAISLPILNFSTSNTTFNNLQFSFSGQYSMAIYNWRSSDHMFNWSFNSGSSFIPKITQIPSQILVEHPSLSLSQLSFSGVGFTKSPEGHDYYVQNIFDPNKNFPSEFYTYSFRQ